MTKRKASRAPSRAMSRSGGAGKINAVGSGTTSHVAADVSDPALARWLPFRGSADADYLGEQDTIVSRSRDLARNNGIAAGAQQTYKDNIVGHQLRLSSKPHYLLLGKTPEWAETFGKQVEAQFETYANTIECDAARQMTLLGLTVQALGGWMLNGDAIGLPQYIDRPGEQWSTKLQLVESDRLSTPPELMGRANVRSGIEYDDFGAPVRYYIRTAHPGDQFFFWTPSSFTSVVSAKWIAVDAFMPNGLRRFIHLHDKERTGQSRGKPIVTAVMREFKMAGHYQTTELQATIANSLIAAFLESNLDPDSAANLFGSDPQAAWDKSLGGYNAALKSAALIPLPAGAKVSPFTPSRPNSSFGAFMESALRHIAAGLNLPYELLLKDFSKTNYSSARASLLEAWRFFNSRRRWIKDYWLTPILELWMDEATVKGRIALTQDEFHANRYAYARCRWVFAGRGWVDPLKEAQSAQARIAGNISTLEDECAEQGLDWEEVLEQRAREQKRIAKLGITPEPPAPTVQPLHSGGVDPTDTPSEEKVPGAPDAPAQEAA
jgi:lambda family phage portal protein